MQVQSAGGQSQRCGLNYLCSGCMREAKFLGASKFSRQGKTFNAYSTSLGKSGQSSSSWLSTGARGKAKDGTAGGQPCHLGVYSLKYSETMLEKVSERKKKKNYTYTHIYIYTSMSIYMYIYVYGTKLTLHDFAGTAATSRCCVRAGLEFELATDLGLLLQRWLLQL